LGKARVISIQDQIEEENYIDETGADQTTTTIFLCQLLNGDEKGEEVLASQSGDVFTG
jgi:hypothetical protein